MDGPIQVQVFAHDGVVLARPPDPVTTAGSRYLAGAGAALYNGLDMITGLHLTLPHQSAAICSTGSSADKSLRLLSRCGLKTPSDLREFRSGAQAVQFARDAAERGETLEFQFPRTIRSCGPRGPGSPRTCWPASTTRPPWKH